MKCRNNPSETECLLARHAVHVSSIESRTEITQRRTKAGASPFPPTCDFLGERRQRICFLFTVKNCEACPSHTPACSFKTSSVKRSLRNATLVSPTSTSTNAAPPWLQQEPQKGTISEARKHRMKDKTPRKSSRSSCIKKSLATHRN